MNINFESPVKTHTEHDKSIPALIELLVLNENGGKTIWYLYFLGVEPTHTKKFTIIVIHVRKITLCTVVKRLLPYLEF